MDGETEHLVEIAVIQSAVPTYANQVPAHQTAKSFRVEGLHELVHIPVETIGSEQKVPEPAYGHVGECIESVK